MSDRPEGEEDSGVGANKPGAPQRRLEPIDLDHPELDKPAAQQASATQDAQDPPTGASQTAADPGPGPVRSVWRTISHNPLISALVAAILAGLFLYFAFGIGGGDEGRTVGVAGGGQQQVEPPKNAVQEAAQRTFWRNPPQTFDGANEPIDNFVEVHAGQATAVTPQELVRSGPSYEGRSIYLVGEVLDAVQRKSEHGLEAEIHMRGVAKNYDAYVGTDGAGYVYGRGLVIYVLGRIAAVGESTSPTGKRMQTVYFISFTQSDPDAIGEVSDTTVYPPSQTIRDAAKGLNVPKAGPGDGVGLAFP